MTAHLADAFDDPPLQAGPRTLRRGLTVLRTLQETSEEGLTVTELSRATGLQRPTIYRLLATLVEAGFANEVPESRRFAARQCARLPPPTAPVTHDKRLEIAYPSMLRLAQATGDAVFLVVREGYDSLTLWREIGPYPVQILATFAGKRQPLGVGSGGMALLASLPDDAVEDCIQHNIDRLEQYGGMTPREMWQLVRNTRTRGYAVVGNHAVRGALGVACALKNASGNPVLSISVTAITERMPTARQRKLAHLIEHELDRMSDRL